MAVRIERHVLKMIIKISGSEPASPSEELVLYASLGLFLVFFGVFLIRQGSPVFPVDDAYISLHSAQVLLTGFDKNFQGSPALVGVTSVIHVTLTALFMHLLQPLWDVQVGQERAKSGRKV
jgi:hypothetical protein